MRVAVITQGELRIEERADPVPLEDEILVRVHAAGVNNADVLQRADLYPPPAGAPVDVPGLECAGEAPDGSRVMALLAGGGHAELVAVKQTHVLRVPENLSWEQAGGFMEAFATAHDALFTQAELKPGERLLVNGAAGGVGTAAIQLGVRAGAEVTGTVRHHAEQIRAFGADTTPTGEYDVIIELVGGANLSKNIERLAPLGRMSVIGTGAGGRAEIDFGLLMWKRGRIYGSVLRSRNDDEKAAVIRRLERDVVPLLARGEIMVPVEETFPIERAQEAYERFAAGGKFGKIIITMPWPACSWNQFPHKRVG